MAEANEIPYDCARLSMAGPVSIQLNPGSKKDFGVRY